MEAASYAGHCTFVTWEIRTLSGRGARYTAKKARRWVTNSAGLGHAFFVRFGSRILRVLVAKKPAGIGLFGRL